jgi:hypothetical protein
VDHLGRVSVPHHVSSLLPTDQVSSFAAKFAAEQLVGYAVAVPNVIKTSAGYLAAKPPSALGISRYWATPGGIALSQGQRAPVPIRAESAAAATYELAAGSTL